MSNRKAIKDLSVIAARYQLTYVGINSSNHLMWLHAPSGRIVTSVRDLGSWRSLNNAARTFRAQVRQIEREVSHGHYHSD